MLILIAESKKMAACDSSVSGAEYNSHRPVFEKEASKIIRNASELREQADYEDFYEATQEDAAEVFEQASKFISVVEIYLCEKSIL